MFKCFIIGLRRHFCVCLCVCTFLCVCVCVSFCAVRVCVSSVESITRRFKRNPGKIPIKQSSGARSRGTVFGRATLSTLGFAPTSAPQDTLVQAGLQTNNKQMAEVKDRERITNGSKKDNRRGQINILKIILVTCCAIRKVKFATMGHLKSIVYDK